METARSEYIRHYERYLPDLLDGGEAEKYVRQVYDYLEMMKPGSRLNLRAEGERLKWMLVAVGAFLSTRGHEDYELNDEYTKLRRQVPWEGASRQPYFRHTVSEKVKR